MDLTNILASTKLTWKVEGSFHYVDLLPPDDPDPSILGTFPYRITITEHYPFKEHKDQRTCYIVSFGRHVLRGKVYDLCNKFFDLEVAKNEALKFAARILLEALCNLSPEITASFNTDIDFAFLGINPDEIEDSPLDPGWKSAPITQANFPRAKKALELAGFEVTTGTNAEKQQWIWWRSKP